jgi:hypothetical protein
MDRGRKALPNYNAEIDAETDARAKEIEAERKRQEEAIGAGAGAASNRPDIDARQKELDDAKRELDDARRAAADARRNADAALAGSTGKPGELPQLDLAAVSDKIKVAGTFSGYAAALMGGGNGPQERTARASELMSRQLARMETLAQRQIDTIRRLRGVTWGS